MEKAELLNIADIAKLALSDEEVEAILKDIEDVLAYFKSIDKYDGEVLTHIVEGEMTLRTDNKAIVSEIKAKAIRENFAKSKDNFARVPRQGKKA